MKSHLLKTISLIRESFVGSEIVYTNGSCVKFAMILLHLYPSGRILYNLDHAIFEYEGECYDINGLCKKGNHIPLEDYGLLQAHTSMNLIYKNSMKEADKKKIISRLLNAIKNKYLEGNVSKAIFYTNRLKQVIENVIID